VLWDKKSFIRTGMENENFINWGYEDNERIERAHKLKVKIFRVPGELFHLDHPRNDDVNFNQKFAEQNKIELKKIASLNPTELRNYVNTWDWV